MAVGVQIACYSSGETRKTRVDWTRPGGAHLVGIGGSGMRSLAWVLGGRGWRLSGSDTVTDGLASALPPGTPLATGHTAACLPPDADVVVHSDAIGRDNPELRRARAIGIPTLTYFDVVGQLMEGRHGLAVAGTHGKSTTTAMAAWILAEAGLDPTVVCGAATLGQTTGGRAGREPLVLAEACEYRENFLKLRPRHAVILGVEPDHFDCYPTAGEMELAFSRFAAQIPPEGLLLAQADCEATRRAVAAASCRVETFGLAAGVPSVSGQYKVPLASRQWRTDHGQDARGTQAEHGQDARGTHEDARGTHCDWSARPIDCRRGRYRFDLLRRGKALSRIELPVAGRHNMLNALAAAALAWHQGVEAGQIADALGRFPGVGRRLEELGVWRGVSVIDDYAHHPTELAATLKTVRQMHPDRRVCCVFQPHQASRTARLLDEFVESLHNGLPAGDGSRRADRLWIAEIFRAREPRPAPGEVTAADLADRLRRRGHDVAGVHRIEDVARDVRDRLEPGDVLLTMGAGDVRRVLDELP